MPRAKQRCSQPDCPSYKPCAKHHGWRKGATAPYPRNWRSLRKQARNFATKICTICGRRDAGGQVDHVVNRAAGGTDDPSNLAWVCTACHKAKTQAESRRGRAEPGHKKRAGQDRS